MCKDIMKLLRFIGLALAFTLSFEARAGHLLQFFAGHSDTDRASMNIELLYIVPPVFDREEIGGNSTTSGIRYLFAVDEVPGLLFGAELSTFDAMHTNVTLDVLPAGLLLHYKVSFDRVETYIGVGLLLAFVEIDAVVDPARGQYVDEGSFADGRDYRFGINVPLPGERYSLFLEYRRSELELDLETESIPILPPFQTTVTQRLTADIDTSQLILGVSWDF